MVEHLSSSLRCLFDQQADVIAELTPELTFSEISESVASAWMIPPSSLMGKSLLSLIHTEEHSAFQKSLEHCCASSMTSIRVPLRRLTGPRSTDHVVEIVSVTPVMNGRRLTSFHLTFRPNLPRLLPPSSQDVAACGSPMSPSSCLPPNLDNEFHLPSTIHAGASTAPSPSSLSPEFAPATTPTTEKPKSVHSRKTSRSTPRRPTLVTSQKGLKSARSNGATPAAQVQFPGVHAWTPENHLVLSVDTTPATPVAAFPLSPSDSEILSSPDEDDLTFNPVLPPQKRFRLDTQEPDTLAQLSAPTEFDADFLSPRSPKIPLPCRPLEEQDWRVQEEEEEEVLPLVVCWS